MTKDDSRVAVVERLEVGKTFALAARIKVRTIENGEVAAMTDRLRENLKSTVRRASENTKHQYTIESVSALVASGDAVLVTVAATRLPPDDTGL